MKLLTETWAWWSGKKTVIGALLLIVYGMPHATELFHLTPEWMDVIYYIGSILSGVGIAHKGSKLTVKKLKDKAMFL